MAALGRRRGFQVWVPAADRSRLSASLFRRAGGRARRGFGRLDRLPAAAGLGRLPHADVVLTRRGAASPTLVLEVEVAGDITAALARSADTLAALRARGAHPLPGSLWSRRGGDEASSRQSSALRYTQVRTGAGSPLPVLDTRGGVGGLPAAFLSASPIPRPESAPGPRAPGAFCCSRRARQQTARSRRVSRCCGPLVRRTLGDRLRDRGARIRRSHGRR